MKAHRAYFPLSVCVSSIFSFAKLRALILGLLALGIALPSLATTYTVTSTADSGPGSLRAALGMAANGDTINFSFTYPATITLTSGYLAISTNVTISGPGAGNLLISGNNKSQVFAISGSSVTAAISGVTIENGYANPLMDSFVSGGGGGIAIYSGALTVTNSTFVGNVAAYAAAGGGAILNGGTLTVINSTFSRNSAEYMDNGGAIYNGQNSTLTVSGSTFSENSSDSGQQGAPFTTMARWP